MKRTVVFLVAIACFACEALTSDDSDANSGQTTAGASEACISNLSIGSGAQNMEGQLGENCSPANTPNNCLDGSFIQFGDTGECICIAKCSSLNVDRGESCDRNGLYICQTVTDMTDGPYCVARNWNVCGDASGTGSSNANLDEANESSSTTGGDETDGTTCKPNGLPCDDDAECCSMTCFSSGCG